MSAHRFIPALAIFAIPALARAQQPVPPSLKGSMPLSQSSLEALFGRRSLLPPLADTVASGRMISTCPMPVARPDTSRLEHMPRAHVDSAKMAPMPVAHGCVAKSK